ncbi:MAG: glycoside hydrolase family 5 protein [Mucilaginibacter polytrichastri]|nr:glycoside hydrolase family 5 protein [Mucilaginibacter polytrichastri]
MKTHYFSAVKALAVVSVAFLSFSCDKKEPQSPEIEKLSEVETAQITNPVATYGQLKVNGNRITDQQNNPVQLRGMSLFWSQWMGQFYNAQAVQWLKEDFHSTVVRAAMGVESGGYLENPEQEKAKVIAVVDAAIAQGLYVIIDWHDHNAQNHTEQAKAFFSEMAQKYGDKPNVIYEIFNEPLDVSWTNVIKPYSEAVIAEIRRHDPDNIIVCGTPFWSQKVNEAANDPITSSANIAYTLHYYAASHKQDLRNVAAQALGRNIALMVTEMGTCEASGNGYLDEAESRAWWSFLDENKISWCNWSVADKEETAAALKPGAAGTGGWTEDALTPSGVLVRNELRAKNP